MRRLYLVFLASISLITCLGQTPAIDSLIRIFPSIKSQEYKEYFSNFDKQVSELPLNKALSTISLVKETPPHKQSLLLEYFFNISLYRTYTKHKKYILADSLLQQNLIYTRQQHLPIWEAETFYELGYLYTELYKYPEAVHYLEQSVRLFLQEGWYQRASTILYDMGSTCYNLNETQGCPDYIKRALQIGKDSLLLVYQASGNNTLGLIKFRDKQYNEALLFYRKALKIAMYAKDSAWIGITQGSIGQCLVSLNKPDEALPYLQNALRLSKKYDDQPSTTRSYTELGNTYRKKQNLSLSRFYYHQGIEFAKKTGNNQVLKDLYYNLAYTYKENKQPDSAVIYLELYNKISEWVSQQNQQIAIAKAQSSFDLQKKEQQVNKLLDTQQRNKQITLFIFIVFILIVIILITLLRVRQKVKINKLLTSQKETLQEKTNLLEIQQQQIEQQRDLLSLQNEQLQESQQIISCQNKEIQQKNQNLEEQIRIRTQKLQENNRQLKDFAFITAHNLRTPVAQILGLGQLLNMPDNETEEEELYLNKIIEVTGRLDQIVKEMNDILTNELPDNLKD